MKVTDARSSAIFATMTEGVVLRDPESRVEACNERAERILDLTADQMAGMRSADPGWRSVHEDGSPFPRDACPAMVTLRTGEPLTGVIRGVHKPDDRAAVLAGGGIRRAK